MEATRAQTIGLLDLPVEIRLRIYRLRFTTHGNPNRGSPMKVDIRSNLLVKDRLWPLFLVCKQIYHEIAPEYYASTSFRFFSGGLLRQTVSSNALFRAFVRHAILYQSSSYISVETLLPLTNLKTFVVLGRTHEEPSGTTQGEALEFSTLKAALREQTPPTYHPILFLAAMEQQIAAAKNVEIRERGIRLLLRFTYAYLEEVKPSGRKRELTSRARRRVIDYDYTDDTFILRHPKDGEERVIMAPVLKSESQV